MRRAPLESYDAVVLVNRVKTRWVSFSAKAFRVFNLARVYKVPPLDCCMAQLIAAAYACTGALRSLLYRTVLVVLLDDVVG